MNILVIGGAVYIGSVTVEELLNKKNNNVFIYDNLSTGYKELINPEATFIKGDMLDYGLLSKTMKENKIDLVIALAAKIVVPESVQHPLEYFQTNVMGMVNILKIMKENNVKKIIFSSSAAVYGTSDKILHEDSIKVPNNPYGRTKLACEWLIENFAKTYDMNFIIFRFFNVAGASDSGKYGMRKENPTLLIPAINKAIINKEKPVIYGDNYKTRDGTCLRDYIHVSDLANAHILGLEYLNRKESNVFNLGSNIGYTVKEVLKIAYKINDLIPDFLIKERRLGDPDSLLTSNEKSKNILGWIPKKDLKDMIKSDYEFRKKFINQK